MNNQCRGCKREISAQHKTCPLCGAAQSFLRYYGRSLLAVLAVSTSGVMLSHWYINQQLASAKQQVRESMTTQLLTAENQIQQLNNELDNLRVELTSTASQLEASRQSIAQSGDSASRLVESLEKKLQQAEQSEKKQADRAGWLSRENSRIQKELESLSATLTVTKSESINTEQSLPSTMTIPPKTANSLSTNQPAQSEINTSPKQNPKE